MPMAHRFKYHYHLKVAVYTKTILMVVSPLSSGYLSSVLYTVKINEKISERLASVARLYYTTTR